MLRRPSALLLLLVENRSFAAVMKKEIWWFSLIPPSFLFVGTHLFGWRIRAEEPIYFEWPALHLYGVLVIVRFVSRFDHLSDFVSGFQSLPRSFKLVVGPQIVKSNDGVRNDLWSEARSDTCDEL